MTKNRVQESTTWIEKLLELNKTNEAEASKDKTNEEAINT